MHEDVIKFLKLLEEDSLLEIFKKYNIDTDYLERDIDYILNTLRDKIHNDYFLFVDKYIGDEEFISELDFDNGLDNLFYSKLFISDEFYYSLLDYFYRDKEYTDVHGAIFDLNDLNYYLNNGVSIDDILKKFEILGSFQYDIYILYPDKVDLLVEHSYSISPKLAALMISNNNYKYLGKYFRYSNNFKADFSNLLIELSKCDFDFKAFFEYIITMYMNDHDISILNDENIVKRFIDIGGSKALVLASNPSADLVNYSDFSFYDYSLYDGSYKKSSPLLLNLLQDGKIDALMYASKEAVNEDVINFIQNNNISLERINSFTNILDSFPLARYFVVNNDYSLIGGLTSVLTDINCFNYVLELVKSGIYQLKDDYRNSEEINFLYCVVSRDWDKYRSYSSFSISLPVALELIDNGLTVDDFAINLSRNTNKNVFIEAFVQKGMYLPLLYSNDKNLVNSYLDYITYSMYEEAISKYGKCDLSKDIIYKFVNEGHYDVLATENLYLSDFDLEKIGLKDISYEKYISLPLVVQNIPILKEKFIEYDSSYLMDLLKNNPTRSVIEKAILSGISFDDILPYINDFTDLSLDSVVFLLKKGDDRGIKYLHFYGNDCKEAVDLYYSLLNGYLPDSKDLCSSAIFNSLLMRKYILNNRFEILDVINNFSDEDIDFLFESGYNFEMFKKHPVMNALVISRFIKIEYEQELVNLFVKLSESNSSLYIYDSSSIILKMYRTGFNKNSIVKMQKIIGVSDKVLLDEIDENEYVLFNYVDLSSSTINNKVLLTKLLKYLSVDKIREIINSYSINTDTKIFLIRKMVIMGFYDFISYYYDRIEEDVLKKALLGGYFPEEQILTNKYFNSFIKKISFSDDELMYLRSRIDSDSRYIIFFSDIVNNYHSLASFVRKNPDIIKLLNVEQRRDINLLKIIAREQPELCSKLFYYDMSSNSVVELIKENPLILSYIDARYLNSEVVKEIVSFYPSVLDYYHGYVDDDYVLLAFKSGYNFSFKSSSHTVSVALKNGVEVDREILKNLGIQSLLQIGKDLINEVDDSLYLLLKDILSEIYSENKYDFIYDFTIFFRNNWYIDGPFKEFLNSFGIDASLYYNFDYSSKENFTVLLRLNELPKEKESLTIIDDILNSCSDKKYVVEWFANNFTDLEIFIQKKYDMAKKYFLDDPLFYIKYVDCNDQDIINSVTNIIDDYPSLYKYVPSILNNKEIIFKLMKKDSASSVYFYLSDTFKDDIDILDYAMKLDESTFAYANHSLDIIVRYAKDHLLEYPIVFTFIPNLINDKETALKLVEYKNGCVYNYLPDFLKKDFDLCFTVLDYNSDLIFLFPNTMERYRELVLKALSINGYYLTRISSLIEIDEEMVVAALKTAPSILFQLPLEFLNERTFAYIDDFSTIDRHLLSVSKVLKIIHFSNFDINNKNNCFFVADFLLSNLKDFRLIDKNDNVIRSVFANAINSYDSDLTNENGFTFRKIVTVLPFIDLEIFDSDLQIVFKNALFILKSNGKLNTLEKNPVFNYDVVKYIYPLFGLEFVLDVIKYNTPAVSVISKEIKANNANLLSSYYDIVCRYNLFDNDDKRVHYAFRNFDKYKELIIDICNSNYELSEIDISNLRKVIIGNNLYDIKTYDELKQYEKKTQDFWMIKLNSNNIAEIKNVLATLFGYADIASLAKDFNNFQLNNYLNLKTLREDIIECYGLERANQIFKECFYNKKDVAIITLMSRIIESQNINELKDLMTKLINDNAGVLDYCDEVRNIIAKIRLLHNYQFNGRLTNIEDLKSKRIDKGDPNNPYGVTIIEMNSEKFNFLVHRIYSYDTNMSGFKEMLINDPSLWTKLEGASTLSTSSISDKGFWFINNRDNNGVVYLFNSLPKSFMLFMNGRDLFVEHGGYKIEPTANINAFTNLNALNQCSCYKHCSYNEVAGFREGMLPCALACVGDVPNEATIRAAKYFSDFLGVDVPIIKFDVYAYDTKKVEDLKKAKADFKISPNYSLMYSIFFDGIQENNPNVSIKEKVDYCLTILNDKYRNSEISFDYLCKSLYEMESIVCQIIVDLPDCKKELTRIGLFRKTLTVLRGMSKEEIVALETANLGESGIMYRYDIDDDSFLLKPAVDKNNYALQPFRADIQEAASKLQEFLSPGTSVRVESIGGKLRFSKQELVEISEDNSDVLKDWVNKGGELDYCYSSALLREYVIDFLLCNFDCYVGNFIIDSSNNLRGIDKEQSFRFISDDRTLNADYSFTPNGNHRIPIYQILFTRYRNGEIDLDLSVITDTINKVKLLSDDDYKDLFRKYAVSLGKDKADQVLELILKRRNDAIIKMEEYVLELENLKKSGGVTL
ncbi:MAG: DUF4116 domain-containing protein [Candidatus Coprovivens sp.]